MKKNWNDVGTSGGGNTDSETLAITGTAVTETRAATTAYRGTIGTTTLKISTHTATNDRPIHVGWRMSGCQNSAVAIPYELTTSKTSAPTVSARAPSRPVRRTAATSRATTIEITPDAQFMGSWISRARPSRWTSLGKKSA